MTEQMQNSVDNVTHYFRLPRAAEFSCLRHGVVHADEKFTMKMRCRTTNVSGRIPMIKRDDIC